LSGPSIIHKTYKFYLNLSLVVGKFSKKDRFILGAKCEQVTLDILGMLLSANAEYSKIRRTILNDIDKNLRLLKLLIRACYDTKSMNQKTCIDMQERLQEIGKMLGGWIKSLS
jgi:hypothetical protein